VSKHRLKLLVLALDGLDPDLFASFREHMPNLSSLADEGIFCPLKSTTPPMTFPAWSSFLTGVNPGKHGIFDFTERIPGKLGVRFLNATRRKCPGFLKILSDNGFCVGSVGVPTTFPPESLSGFQISGFDTPLPSKADISYVNPPNLVKKIDKELGGYYFGNFNEGRINSGWHETVLEKMLGSIAKKRDLVRLLVREYPLDVLVLHIGETDTVGHHFWSFCDPESPRHTSDSKHNLRDAIQKVYRAADQLTGNLLDDLDPESTLIASDHGMGGTSDRMIFLNNYLSEHGLLQFSESNSSVALMGHLKKAGMKWIPYRFQQALFKLADGKIASNIESVERFSGIDWQNTLVHSEELNYFPAISFNLKDRDPFGVVSRCELSTVFNRVRDCLLDWKDPFEGSPVVKNVLKCEEVYSGSETKFAPDIILELNKPSGYSYALGKSATQQDGTTVKKISADQYIGFKGASMNGSHRQFGTVIFQSGDMLISAPDDCSLLDIAPTILHLFDVDKPDWMDGVSMIAGEQSIFKSRLERTEDYYYTNQQEKEFRKKLISLVYLG